MKQRCLFLRKSCVALLIGLLTVASVSAQEQRSVRGSLSPTIGVKGGLNLSNLYVDDVDDARMKAGLNLGLFAKLPITPGLSIQPEVLYSSKGSKISYNNVFGDGAYRFNLNYIEVPILAVINLGRNFNIHAGPYASYLTSANIKAEDDGASNNQLVSFNEDDFNRIDYGLAGGIGIDISKLTIGARYNYGLREVGKSSEITTAALRNSKNSVFTVYLGFGF